MPTPRVLRLAAVALLLAKCLVFSVVAQEAVSEAVVVRADRLPDATASAPFRVTVVSPEDLRSAPQLRLDDILRAQVPGFSLFRRSSSRVANPTTQGVTLRNFGPSGAGRTLVLLDGIPLNDPFAGYVLWNQVPPAAIESVIVQPGGGAGLYGNAALAGTIFLISKRDEADATHAQAIIGAAESFGGSVSGSVVRPSASFSAFADVFSTGGYPVLQLEQRGRVDTHATAESRLLQLQTEFNLGRDSSLALHGRHFHEERGNGTRFTRNETKGTDASITWTTKIPHLSAELRVAGYYQGRRYRSTFSAIDDPRETETPALDQYRVPATAAGGSAVWTTPLGSDHKITLGADTRWVEGETNERFRFIADEFTRRRVAGGEQFFLGAFLEDTWLVTSAATVVGSIRVDHWQLSDGRRTEFDRGSGRPTLTSRFADRDGTSVNGRLGTSLKLSSSVTARAAFYSGFRLPTLNELYRPFRVGNAVTEANAELAPERLLGGETGFEWNLSEQVRIAGTFFYNRLQEAIGNVTVGFGPGTFEPGGFIPAGGVLRQRENIELVTAPGFEFSASWQVFAQFGLKASYLFTRPVIDRAAEPGLVGNRLAQTPEHVLNASVEWKPSARWLLTLQSRYSGPQFEDDQNRIELAPFFAADAAIFYQITDEISVSLRVENFFDRETETGKTPDGLVSIGAPRLTTLQLQWRL